MLSPVHSSRRLGKPAGLGSSGLQLPTRSPVSACTSSPCQTKLQRMQGAPGGL